MAQQPSDFERVVRNAAILGAAQVGGRLLSFFAIVHLSRTLQPGGMGVVEFGLAIFGVFHVMTCGGVELLATRRAARSAAGLRRLAGTTVLVGGVFFTPPFLALLVLVWLGLEPSGMWRGALLFALAAALTPAGLGFAFLGRERMGVVALSSVLVQGLFLALCLSLVHDESDVLRVAGIWATCEGVRAALQLHAFRRRYGAPRFSVRVSRLRPWLRATLPVTLARLSRGLLFNVDLLLLGVLVTPTEVGIYGVAARIPLFLAFLSLQFHTAIFPAVTRALAAGGSAHLRRIHRETLQAALGAAIPVALAVSVVSLPLVTLLFGDTYRDSAALLPLLLGRSVIVAVGGLYRNLLLAGRPSHDARFTTAGLAVTVTVIVALVPILGLAGAAIGTILGEATLLVCYFVAARRWVGVVSPADPGWVARLVGAVGLVVTVLWMAVTHGPLIMIGVTLVAGGAGALLVNSPFAVRLWRRASRRPEQSDIERKSP